MRNGADMNRANALRRVSHTTLAPDLSAASMWSASHGVTVWTSSARMLKIRLAFSNCSDVMS